MKKYIEPKFEVSMFSAETISASEATNPLSLPYGEGVSTFMTQQSTANKIKKQYNFNEAIKFN